MLLNEGCAFWVNQPYGVWTLTYPIINIIGVVRPVRLVGGVLNIEGFRLGEFG